MSTMIDAVNESLDAAEHLTATDAGAVALLRVFAEQIDEKADAGEGWEFPAGMLRLMNSLGLTPQGRRQNNIAEVEQTGGALDGLRRARDNKYDEIMFG